MAECKIEEAEFKENFESEMDAKSFVYSKYMAKQLLDSEETSKAFMGEGFWSFFRLDRAGVTDMSANKLVRGVSEILYESIGKVGKNWVRSRTMSQVKQFELNRQRALYYREWVRHYDDFLKENNYSRVRFEGITKRNEFNEMLARAIRGEVVDSPSINAMAKAHAERMKDMLEMAKAAGVRGADKVVENANYLTRIYSKAKLVDMIGKHGEDSVVEFLARAMRGGVDNKANKKLAKYLIRVVRRGNEHNQINLGSLFTAKAEDLQRILKDTTDLDNGAIEEIILAMFPSKPNTSTLFRSRRVQLDETYSDSDFAISDFLENDAEVLFLNYANNITGQIALAQRGFKSTSDWKAMMRQIEKQYDDMGVDATDKTRLNELKALNSGFDHLIGKPLEDISTNFSTFGRIMRKYNFARIMNQVGFAQLAEIGVLTANIGLRQTIKHLPEMRKLLKRMKNGEIDDEFMKEAEELFGGFGSERLINQVANQTDEFGSRVGKKRISQIERGLDHVGRFTADISGMNLVNTLMKRIALKGMVQKYVDEAFGGVAAMSKKRYQDLGISETMHKRILDAIKKHSITDEGALTKRKIRRLNADNWDDAEAAETFAYAINRWGRRTIQENDIGETMFLGGFTDTTFGKIMFQFRGFMMTAYGKHLLHGAKMRDTQAFIGFMSSMVFAGLAYTAQMNAQAVLMNKRDRKKFFEKKFGKTDGEIYMSIAKAAFQRSAFASLLPAFVDSGLGVLGADPFFHYRSTGLDSNLLTGNPTVSLIKNNLYKGVSGSIKSMWDKDYEFSQSQYNDLTQLLLFQNALGIQNVIKKIGSSTLPKNPQ
ncbi:putative internal virion protein [Pelagibacter phage Hroenn EXVC015P]|nr:putative internal virion protein [Pelagibacter phage Bylgja EXVC010P]QLF88308.1 putative internal virion protein [Pelagibacter phage Himinglaeva EXVC011P]QLF88347.1 putative internal virion protein [Pelagibacter phage Hroenn EXVC015P]QLF88606.1 putative internal virion protein [Pelagibacter phage Unn EXVC019P]